MNRRGFFGAIAAACASLKALHLNKRAPAAPCSSLRPVRLHYVADQLDGPLRLTEYEYEKWRPAPLRPLHPLQGPMLTITRHGIAIDASDCTTPHAAFDWEQIDRWRASVGNRELWLASVERPI